MSNLCNHFSGGGKSEPTNVILSEAKNLGNRPNGKNIALAILLATALTACNNEESFDMPDAGKLSINVGVNHPTSRALITAATLPDGDAGAIGVMLTDGDGTITDYNAYTNVKFTGATASGSQKWTGATDVLLTENPGTLYAYYPWKDGTNLSSIAIETASQTDYLYATPVTGISETKANADVVMNHVLTNINLSFADGTYAGVGNITSVSVNGDGIATGGTFNAAQETPGFVADSYTGVGDAITNTTATTLGGNAIDIMVVSNDASAPITITATIDGVEYTATTTAVELTKGNSYQYTLTLNSTFMSVSKVSVTPWNNVVKENLTLEKVLPVEGIVDLKTASNGVYAVAQNGLGVTIDDADESCIAVALITDNQKVMIAKSDATDGTNTTFFWDKSYSDLLLTNYGNADGTNSYGYLGGTLTPQLNKDFTTWEAGALSDFNGKFNTAFIAAASSDASDMCTVLNTFNASDSYKDWYVPALGQLALMYLNMTEINAALAKIGGTALAAGSYWSSSEGSSYKAWHVGFNNGVVSSYDKDNDYGRRWVRFVRDIVVEPAPENPTGPAIDATGKANGVYVVTAAGQLVDKTTVDPTAIGVALITDNQRIMIEKYGEGIKNRDIIKAAYDADADTNTDYKYFYWGSRDTDVAGITNSSSEDAAEQDFNGKVNTAAIIATPDTDDKTTYANMGTYCTKFNEMNGGYNDWYIPAEGQLRQIYGYKTDINTALTNIAGTTFNTAVYYWSSSELSSQGAWYVNFQFGYAHSANKSYYYYVRFVRDLQ